MLVITFFYDLVQNRIKYVCIKMTGFMNLPRLQHCSDSAAVYVVNAALFTAVSEDSKEHCIRTEKNFSFPPTAAKSCSILQQSGNKLQLQSLA